MLFRIKIIRYEITILIIVFLFYWCYYWLIVKNLMFLKNGWTINLDQINGTDSLYHTIDLDTFITLKIQILFYSNTFFLFGSNNIRKLWSMYWFYTYMYICVDECVARGTFLLPAFIVEEYQERKYGRDSCGGGSSFKQRRQAMCISPLRCRANAHHWDSHARQMENSCFWNVTTTTLNMLI